jgi:mannose-6-phosphate isomerase-like protein (cupin superfamily)
VALQKVNLEAEVVHLADTAKATVVPMAADFWVNMPPILGAGRMVARLPQTADWTGWEMHPRGDELILVLSGRIRFHCHGCGDLEAGPGETVLIPAGIWHTADVLEPAEIICITEGGDSQHRPR